MEEEVRKVEEKKFNNWIKLQINFMGYEIFIFF
jgi:hypothetical protein